jgi:hypothetical protein
MANQTKAQLIDELIRIRAHSDHIETQLQVAVARNAELARQLDAARMSSRAHSARPAYMDAAAKRRALSRQYFAAFPDARSVTDEQLRDFAAEYEAA